LIEMRNIPMPTLMYDAVSKRQSSSALDCC
jgi:hypothetical protein